MLRAAIYEFINFTPGLVTPSRPMIATNARVRLLSVSLRFNSLRLYLISSSSDYSAGFLGYNRLERLIESGNDININFWRLFSQPLCVTTVKYFRYAHDTVNSQRSAASFVQSWRALQHDATLSSVIGTPFTLLVVQFYLLTFRSGKVLCANRIGETLCLLALSNLLYSLELH